MSLFSFDWFKGSLPIGDKDLLVDWDVDCWFQVGIYWIASWDRFGMDVGNGTRGRFELNDWEASNWFQAGIDWENVPNVQGGIDEDGAILFEFLLYVSNDQDSLYFGVKFVPGLCQYLQFSIPSIM